MREVELQGQVNALKAETERQNKLIGQVNKLIGQVIYAHTWFSFNRLIFQSYSNLGYSRLGRSPKVNCWELFWQNFIGRIPRSCRPANSVKTLKDDSVPD